MLLCSTNGPCLSPHASAQCWLAAEGISSTIHANIDEMVEDRKEVLELVASHIDTGSNGNGNGSSAMASGRQKGTFGAASQQVDG